MELHLANVIDTCLSCSRRFATIREARQIYQELGALTSDQSDVIARQRRLDPMTMRGLAILARHVCMALDWLDYHHQPLTRNFLQQLEAEFKDADPKHDVLKWELCNGVREILRKVDWETPAS